MLVCSTCHTRNSDAQERCESCGAELDPRSYVPDRDRQTAVRKHLGESDGSSAAPTKREVEALARGTNPTRDQYYLALYLNQCLACGEHHSDLHWWRWMRLGVAERCRGCGSRFCPSCVKDFLRDRLPDPEVDRCPYCERSWERRESGGG